MRTIQIGQLLIEQGALTERQVEHILRIQKISNRPFGDLAERLYGVSPRAIEDAWVEQYIRVAGVVDLDEQDVDVRCLRLLNRRQAWQFHLLPMARETMGLQMATTSDHLVRALNFASRKLGEPVNFLLAEHEQLQEFLMKHYPVPRQVAQYAAGL